MSGDVRARLRHEPALDGLRGLAVAAVLLFHGGKLKGGYLGVDAFFVLSGFLITSLLLAESKQDGTLSLTRFWARRARRLLPALACVLAAVSVYAVLLAHADELATIRHDALATLFYVANWRQVAVSNDYFAILKSPSPLQHTWSLAIEEQFYLLWPIVVFALVRGTAAANAARRVLVAAVTLTFASLIWGQFLYATSGAARVYYGTDTRLASITIGAALAALLALRGQLRGPSARWLLELSAIVAGVTLAAAWTRLGGSSPFLYRGGLALCAIATALVIAASVHDTRGPVARALSWRPLCRLGLVSYGVYLWHWPIYVVLDPSRVHLGGWPLLAVRIAVTLAVACISYRWIEQPIRRGAGTPLVTRLAVPVVFIAVVVAILASTVSEPTPVRVARAPTRGGLLVVGDSVGTTLVQGLQAAGLNVTDRTVPGCSLVPGTSERILGPDHASSCGPFADDVRRQRPTQVLLVTGVFETVDVKPAGSSQVFSPGTPAWATYYENQLQQAIDALGSTGAPLIIPTVPCMSAALHHEQNEQFDSTQLATLDYSKGDLAQMSFNPVRQRIENDLLLAVAARPENRKRVVTPDLNRFLCPAGVFEATVTGAKADDIRPDGEHFSPQGADIAAQWLAGQIREVRSSSLVSR